MKISISIEHNDKDTLNEHMEIKVSTKTIEPQLYQVAFMLSVFIENQSNVTTFFKLHDAGKHFTIIIFKYDDYGIENTIKTIDEVNELIKKFMEKHAS
mgnify:CR=1 FL=1